MASAVEAARILEVDGLNCTRPAIDEFPSDLFTADQRENGAVVVHVIASIYIFYALALLCDDYIVPAFELICQRFSLPPDVAGASLMAFTTSAPELFTNIVGTFVTEGDIGVGTIVGSAMINIFGVCACCGFAAESALQLDWYSLTRDSLMYLVAVVAFIVVIIPKGQVYWYEATIFIVLYIGYMIIMYHDRNMRDKLLRIAEGVSGGPDEESPLIPDKKQINENSEINENNEVSSPFSIPSGFWKRIFWIITLPARLVLTATIPDCRTEKFRSWYPLTLIMSSVHIGVLTYAMAWMMTIVGDTFGIPDSVMGLTFIAWGNSIPEVVSSFIVARQGLGAMSISNSLGSNTFDILFCLGLPWLLRTIMIASKPINYIQIISRSLQYSVGMLLISIILFYLVLAVNKFKLDKKVATTAAILYAIFLVLACILELDIFMDLNIPMCDLAR